jgi:hypothetical protein
MLLLVTNNPTYMLTDFHYWYKHTRILDINYSISEHEQY